MIIIISAFLTAFFSLELIKLFFSSEYYSTITIIPIIVFGYLFSLNSGFLNNMIYQEKKTTVIMYLHVFAAFLNIILNYVLVPKFGVLGAAWATFFSFFTIFIIIYFYARKFHFAPYNWNGIITLIFCFVFNFSSIHVF